jgi:hypothetical protein
MTLFFFFFLKLCRSYACGRATFQARSPFPCTLLHIVTSLFAMICEYGLRIQGSVWDSTSLFDIDPSTLGHNCHTILM